MRNGQQDNLVDPTANQIYVQGKELQQEKAQNTDAVTNSNLCLKGKIVIVFIHVMKYCIVLYCMYIVL